MCVTRFNTVHKVLENKFPDNNTPVNSVIYHIIWKFELEDITDDRLCGDRLTVCMREEENSDKDERHANFILLLLSTKCQLVGIERLL